MDLEALDHRLANHFGALARDRNDIPLFALEHGLAQAELLVLQNALRAHIRTSAPAREHRLAWVVYAAEIGYGYAGNEYWQTFEEKTPGWTLNGRRDWIRDAFVAFQRKFAGAKPSGAWAEQFSIISWPITHAILPRDLQQQLARILYDLRHSFSAELFDDPQRLGDFIAARSWDTSARFQNLVQAPALVGQIAAALLLQGREGFKALLDPNTLKRIGDDVDRERRGRDWLRFARRAAEERATIRGLTIGRPIRTTLRGVDEARAEVVRLGIEPRLVLRPIEDSKWEVSLEVPDLSHLLIRFPQVRDVLTESRCTVAGAAGRPLARGRCLHGPQRVPLSRWPRPDEVLLKFERTDVQLDYLLRAECMLRPGTSWLFKVASDGLAYESRGMRVRAGARYVLVRTIPFTSAPLAHAVDLSCQGVYAAILDVPAALTAEWEQALKQFQITQAKSIEVWPAGLAAVAWDGEGHGEWLASETPTLAISSDHVIDELAIAMGDGPSLSVGSSGTPPGEPIFIELPPLAVGLHKVSIAARSRAGASSEVIGDLDVVMRVREARPWASGATAHGPLEMELDPAAPSLEQLWEGRAAVVVRGPVGRQVKCRIKMFARDGEPPLFDRHIPPITLPLVSEEWARLLEKHVKGNNQASLSYDDAQVCEVEFSADELGVLKLRCAREFTPLRWTIRRDSAGFIAYLHDDVGSGVPVIKRHSFEQPGVGEMLEGCQHRVPRDGGLYVATQADFRAAIVAPPIVKDFAELKCAPKVSLPGKGDASITFLLSLARLWGEARVSGSAFAGARRRLVVRDLTARVAALISGDNWGRLEEEFARGDLGLRALRRAIPHHNQGRQMIDADQIFPRDTLKRLGDGTLQERLVAFVSFAAQLPSGRASANQGRLVPPGVSGLTVVPRADNPKWLAELALRMASDPSSAAVWAGEFALDGIKRLRETPTLARAARFLVLAVDHHREHPDAGEFYGGWGWSCDV